MVIQSNDVKLNMISRRKLADLAYRERISDAEMMRRLVDRAYAADLLEQTGGIKPNTPPNDG